MKRVNSVVALMAVALLLLLAVLALPGCGKGGKDLGLESASDTAASSSRELPSLEEALAEVDEYPRPKEVDAVLWERLKERLKAGIVARYNSKTTSATASGQDPVTDLSWSSDWPTGPVQLSWSYHNLGDYNQNSLVEVGDITPVAIHYGHSRGGTWDALDEVIDGNFDGTINDLDIDVLSNYYGNSVEYYSIRASDDPPPPENPDEWLNEQEMELSPFSEADGGESPDQRRVFHHVLTTNGMRYWVVIPWDNLGTDPVNYGAPSNVLDLGPVALKAGPPSGTPGEQVEVSMDVSGPRPPGTTYLWNFGGGADPNVVTDPETEVTLIEGVWQASFTVNNTFAADNYEWTLVVSNAPHINGVYIVPDREPTGAPGEQVAFAADWTGSPQAATFSWDFGGGADPDESNLESPTVTLGAEGTYNANIAITNYAGSHSYDFALQIGRQPIISAVDLDGQQTDGAELLHGVRKPTNVGTWTAILDLENGGPATDWSWDFGGGAEPDASTAASPETKFPEARQYEGSVEVSNDFGSDALEFPYIVHMNKLYLLPEPPVFDRLHDYKVTIRVIAVDTGYPLTFLNGVHIHFDDVPDGLVKADTFTTTLDDTCFDTGALQTPFEGFWSLFNGKAAAFVTDPSLAGPWEADYWVNGEHITDKKYVAVNISPVFDGAEPYAAPRGSGLPPEGFPLSAVQCHDGDLFEFELMLGDIWPDGNTPQEVEFTLVERCSLSPGGEVILVTTYTSYEDLDLHYFFDLIQQAVPVLDVGIDWIPGLPMVPRQVRATDDKDEDPPYNPYIEVKWLGGGPYPPYTYKVSRSTQVDGTYSEIGQVNVQPPYPTFYSYKDYAVESGTPYYYKVSGVNGVAPPYGESGLSDPSNEASIP